ncbi:MAG: hypothetical protein WC389_01245 [Lutibacter sp.]|jgi:hypothetical protein
MKTKAILLSLFLLTSAYSFSQKFYLENQSNPNKANINEYLFIELLIGFGIIILLGILLIKSANKNKTK